MFTTQDIVVSESILHRRVSGALANAKARGELTNYRSSFQIESSSDVLDWGNGANASKYVLAYAKHREQIIQNAMDNMVNILNYSAHPKDWSAYQWHTFGGGLKSVLRQRDITEYSDIYVRVNSGLGPHIDEFYRTSDSNVLRKIVDDDDESKPILVRAYARARRLAVSNYGMDHPFGGTQLYTGTEVSYKSGVSIDLLDPHGLYVEFGIALNLVRHKYAMEVARPTAKDVIEARNAITQDMLSAAQRRELDRRDASQQNFKNYWGSMKSHAQSFVHKDEVLASFNTIPMLPVGTSSSRRWGIEIEVVQAQLTSRPAGWEQTSDGSLEAVNQECNCSCDDCDNSEHCEYDDCSGGDTCEYVSPILSSFNSAGVKQLSDELKGSEVNDSAGVHIHCDAADLSIADVARLCVAYSAISPFLWKIMDRNVNNYCRDITTENLTYWLAMWRKYRKGGGVGNAITMSREMMPVGAVRFQPDDRYRDLNLQALSAHGTIEFRAMGPVYDYERLIRWAWMCRELVNVSKLDLPQSTWTNIRSMADVVRVLQTYGSEQLPAGITKLFESGDSLEVEECAEASND